MSVLVVCRGLQSTLSDIEVEPVAELPRASAYQEALQFWGRSGKDNWVAVLSWQGVSWGDLVNEALLSSRGCERIVSALGDIARASQEVAVWYAGFPDDVPVARDVAEFERILAIQIRSGDLEPAARIGARRRS